MKNIEKYSNLIIAKYFFYGKFHIVINFPHTGHVGAVFAFLYLSAIILWFQFILLW